MYAGTGGAAALLLTRRALSLVLSVETILSNNEMAAQQRLARRIQRFLDHAERVTRWQYDHVEHAIEALHALRIAEGEDFMLKAEQPHVFRAPTDLDGGNGSTAVLHERLLAVLQRTRVET